MNEPSRLHAAAAARNRDPILAVLAQYLPPRGQVLEVASGTGEHACYFAARLPQVQWQPSDPDPLARASINAWAEEVDSLNLLPALALDVLSNWPPLRADAIVCINMIHIAPKAATTALLTKAADRLAPGAPLILYGPFRRRDRALEPSNAAFDQDLKRRNLEWGLRELEAVIDEATAVGFASEAVIDMPANNLTLVLRRQPSPGGRVNA